MTDLIDAHRSPLAGWVIAQCHGLTLIGKPSGGPTVRSPDGHVTGRKAEGGVVGGGLLSPVYEVKPQLIPQGQGMTTVHLCVPLWLLVIDEVELPAGCIVVPCESLSRAEQQGLKARIKDAEQLVTQMRAAASGISLVKSLDKVSASAGGVVMVTFGPTLSAVADVEGNVHVSANLCETCKHWVPFGYTIDAYADRSTTPAIQGEPEHRYLEAWEVKNEMGLCRKVDGHRRAQGDDSNDWQAREALAVVEDLSDHAFLRTAPSFGCVLWEAK